MSGDLLALLDRATAAGRRMPAPVLPRTYPRRHLDDWTDADWLAVPVRWVPTPILVPSQQGLSLDVLAHLVNGGTSESGDFAGRAVLHAGVLNLHDGHHRWAVAMVRGEPLFPVRTVAA